MIFRVARLLVFPRCFLRFLSASAPAQLRPPGLERRWSGVGAALEGLWSGTLQVVSGCWSGSCRLRTLRFAIAKLRQHSPTSKLFFKKLQNVAKISVFAIFGNKFIFGQKCDFVICDFQGVAAGLYKY